MSHANNAKLHRFLLATAVALGIVGSGAAALAEPRGAGAAPASQVHLDAHQRPIVPTPSTEAPPLPKRRAARPLPQPQPAPGGGTMIILDERFDQKDIGRRGTDGRVHLQHEPREDAAE
jgi:hypothetical protein